MTTALRGRLPPHRHRDGLRATRRRSAQAIRASGIAARRALRHHQALERRPGPRAGQAPPSTASLERLGLELRRPLPHPLARPVARTRYVETWKAFIELQEEGLARSIGVSNFQPDHLERLIDETGVAPVDQPDRAAPLPASRPGCAPSTSDRGIVTEAWSPLAQGEVARRPAAHGDRRRARRHAGPGRAALARAARQRRDPEVGHARAHRAELRPLRLRADAGRDGPHRDARPGERVGPDPDTLSAGT